MNEYLDLIKPCDIEKPYMFVSYSKRDAGKVYPFILRLQQMGCNLWIDKELRRSVGSNWQKNVLAALQSACCRGVLFMISEHSMRSAAVFAELSLSQTSSKVHRRHDGMALKILPVNADLSWSQSKVGLATWIYQTVCKDTTPLSLDDYDCLNVGKALERYRLPGSAEYIEERGEIASAILTDILEPLGGSKLTVASIEELDTVLENIDKECFANGLPKGGKQPAQISVSIASDPVRPQDAEIQRKVYKNGDVYEGQLSDGKRHGQGIYRFANGSVYEGEYRDGKRCGFGRFSLANGDVYEGEFLDNKYHGHGIFRFSNGEVLEGGWENGVHIQNNDFH
ncbi:MAG: TIR domain-containing protein [Lachnospiraceae bacterium]|nr:TIR domain-containing protein [Lachnospiraceae bacterium]